MTDKEVIKLENTITETKCYYCKNLFHKFCNGYTLNGQGKLIPCNCHCRIYHDLLIQMDKET